MIEKNAVVKIKQFLVVIQFWLFEVLITGMSDGKERGGLNKTVFGGYTVLIETFNDWNK